MVVRIKVEIFWVVSPYSVSIGYLHFGGCCYLHLHPEDLNLSQNGIKLGLNWVG